MPEKSMRVRDLRATLDSVRNMFKAFGASAQEKAIGNISAGLSDHDDLQLEQYLEEVHRRAADVAAPPSDQYARRLAAAGFDETRFLLVLSEMQKDTRLRKAEMQRIVSAYGGTFDRRASKELLLDRVKAAFYSKLYERDTNAIARKAKPI
jgi:hypothetical protein